MDLDALLADLQAKFNADKAGVLAALQAKVHGLYQMSFDAGHRAATAAERTAREAVEARLTEATTAREKAEKDLRDYQAKTPDVAKVTEQFQAEIARLNTEHEQALKAEKAARTEADLNRAMSDLQIRLGRLVKPALAKVLVQDKDIRDRVKVKADGSYEVMQAGKTIPFSPAEGKDVLELLAAEIAEKQDADMRLVDGDEGSGAQSGSTKAGASKTVFDRVRENKKAEIEGRTKAQTVSLEQRLGMVPA
jgi:hypothetical protein